MDSKLKSYLDRKFKDLPSKKDLKALEKKMEDNSSDILTLIRKVSSHLSTKISEIDLAHSHLHQHFDHIFKRIEYLEKKILNK